MSTKVTYTDKTGSRVSSTFGSRQLAESFSRTVKAPELTEVETIAPELKVVACPTADASMMQDATRSYYANQRATSKVVGPISMSVETLETLEERAARIREEEYLANEREAEQAAERAAEARLFPDYDYCDDY